MTELNTYAKYMKIRKIKIGGKWKVNYKKRPLSN